MAKIKVLIEGYAKKIKNGWLASSTTTLIQEKNYKIIVDPGINRKVLLKKLSQEGLKPQEIDYVFMTHYHPDHNLLAGLFPRAKFLDDELIYEKDKQIEHQGAIPGTDIKIIPTPGHEAFHSSLLVPTSKAQVAVAGDVFWWASHEKQKTDQKNLLKHQDPFVKNQKALLKSRQKILKMADWIIPGHGKMFKNPNKK